MTSIADTNSHRWPVLSIDPRPPSAIRAGTNVSRSTSDRPNRRSVQLEPDIRRRWALVHSTRLSDEPVMVALLRLFGTTAHFPVTLDQRGCARVGGSIGVAMTINTVATGPSTSESSHQVMPLRPFDCAKPALMNVSVPHPTVYPDVDMARMLRHHAPLRLTCFNSVCQLQTAGDALVFRHGPPRCAHP